MKDKDIVIQEIRTAFEGVTFPGDWCLQGSLEGEEPFKLAEEFKGKTDWTVLDPEFLDLAPDGFASALSFFSDEAFRFYLPAYLIADLNDQLLRVDVVFYLTHGLEPGSVTGRINPQRYGDRTWLDFAQYKFSMFTQQQTAAITAYLEYKLHSDTLTDYEKDQIRAALERYWQKRSTS